MKKLAIYGFGGFGKEVAALIKKINCSYPTWDLIGFFDDGVSVGHENRYGKVLGDINTLNLYPEPLSIIIAVANPIHLNKISKAITNNKVEFPNIIAPGVNIFDEDALVMGKGNIVFWGCRLSCDVIIGNFNLINGTVSLGHDTTIGDCNVIGPSVRVSGGCIVGDQNLFGAEAMMIQGLRIGNNTKIGMGSVVIRHTQSGSSYFGNPAKLIDAY